MSALTKVKRYIKIDFSKCKDSVSKKLLNMLTQQKYRSYVKAKSSASIVIAIPLFNLYEYELEDNKEFAKKLRLTLYEKDLEKPNSQLVMLLDDVKIHAAEYDELLRTLRF